jgi:hypothetical protein
MTWQAYYSKNTTVEDIAGGGFSMKMNSKTEPHYILRGGKSFASAKSILWAMSTNLEPDSAVIKATEGSSPAAGTVMLQRSGDDLSGVGKYADYRLWSGAHRIRLVEGAFEAECPMTYNQWTNVNGQQPSAKAFNGMVNNLAKAGVTFGGMFFGHGVRVSGGSAVLIVTKFKAA